MSTSPEFSYLCLACNYPLQGLTSTRCPECGRPFDPADPKTMNLGRPLGGFARRLLQPIGLPTLLLAAAALLGVAWVTRWPGNRPKFSLVDHREAMRVIVSQSPIERWKALFPADRIFTAAVAAAWLAMIWLALRELLRLGVIVAKRPKGNLQPPRRKRRILAIIILTLSVVVVGYGWPYRLGRHFIAQKSLPTSQPSIASMTPFGAVLSSSEARQVCRTMVTSMPLRKERFIGLQQLIECGPGEALAELVNLAARERDAELLEAEIHLIGLYRKESTVAGLRKFLTDPRPAIRAAAADAIGIIYAPAYDVPPSLEVSSNAWLDSGDVSVEPIVEWVYRNRGVWDANANERIPDDATLMPLDLQALLRQMMVAGDTTEEREAAARTMLRWPPVDYKLRCAEWGVWIDSGGKLEMVQSVIDEIPPFVHRMGNPIGSLADRVNDIRVVTKPIIHLTASKTMAVDVQVLIRGGRPWFGYPRPDDFNVEVNSIPIDRASNTWSSGMLLRRDAGPLKPLDNTKLPKFEAAREGYPWLGPHHREFGSITGFYQNNKITSLGLRWQSLIVSPEKLSWMQPPQVPGNPNYQWWSRLRDVPCSWVSSRGEADRFVYYDGPTLEPSPVLISESMHVQSSLTDSASGLYIIVRNGQAAGVDMPLTKFERSPMVSQFTLHGSQVEARLKSILKTMKLTDAEADGLIASWRRQFFGTEGRRFLTIFHGADYDHLCPLTIRPEPTEKVRMGILLSEMGH